MNGYTAAAIAALGAYLIGSIPFGFLIAKWFRGIDIREHGSGNIGATNVRRILGNEWGGVVLCLDLLKGLLPVLLLPSWLLTPESSALLHVQVITGVAAVAGHMLPCYLKFRGGKGVATALGVVIVLGGWGVPVAIVLFLLTLATTRLMSLSSILGSCGYAIAQWVLLYPYQQETISLLVFSTMVPLLIIVRHRGNIVRIFRGEEDRINFQGKSS